MKQLKMLMGLLLLVMLPACSSITTEAEHNDCQVAFGVAGAGIGAAVANVPGAAGGTAVGIILGNFFCGDGGSEPMMAPEPEMSGNFLISDGDNDGVRDEYDKCPNTPEGVAVDGDGCANDNDGDGVPDYLDQCPETPLGQAVDLTGCSAMIVSLQGVHFAFDSAQLTSEAKSILNQAAGAMKSNPSSHFTVEGHTDSTGPDGYNRDLSQRRAQSVANYLASRGVTASISAVGKGESSPVASNDTSSGRAKNRRVEVYAR